MYVLDTNVFIYQAGGDEAVVSFFEEHAHGVFYLPSIVVAEFLSYPLITDSSIDSFKRLVSQMITVSLDFAIAEQAATLRRTHRTKLADSIIAATALVIRAPLLTRNTRDFKRITELKIVDV